MHSHSRRIADLYLGSQGPRDDDVDEPATSDDRPRAPWAPMPDDLSKIWLAVDSLPALERARWRCAMTLAWREGARGSDIVAAQVKDFDLAEPSWVRPLMTPRGSVLLRVCISPESAAAVAELAASFGEHHLTPRESPVRFRWMFSRIAKRAGAAGVSFAQIRVLAAPHLFADRSISDEDFYAIYPARGMWIARAPRPFETRHDRGF